MLEEQQETGTGVEEKVPQVQIPAEDKNAKKLISEDDWRDIYQDIELKWNQSNPIIENAELDNLQKRFEMVQELKQSGVVGTIVPLSFITDKILKMTDEEFNEMQKQIEKEKKKGFHAEPKEDEE